MVLRIALAMAFVLEGSAAFGQSADTVINACVATATGRVRIADAAGACKRKERALTWNAQGAAGAAGAAGGPGPQGDPGDPGPPGTPPCQAIGRLTIAGIMGDGAGGSMVVYAYHVAVEPPAAGGPPTIVDFSVTKPIDKASPALAQAALLGTIAPTGKLEIFAADHVTVATTYDFTLALISSITTGAPSVCSLSSPVDAVTLSLGSLTAS